LQTRQGLARRLIGHDLCVGVLAHNLPLKGGKIFVTGVDRGV
jgi:hypothetical protein